MSDSPQSHGSRRSFCLVGLAAALAPVTSWAEPYPSKPIQIIVPYAAGGPADILARAVSDKLSTGLKQPVVVMNQTGAEATSATRPSPVPRRTAIRSCSPWTPR